MLKHIRTNLEEARTHLDSLLRNEEALRNIESAGNLLLSTFKSGNKVISCGNGGSHCDAMHFAEEFAVRFRKNRKPLPAVAISDPSFLTCTGNDFGFEEVFSQYVWGHGKKGDVLFALSTSGSSKNVLLAAERARDMGMKVIALTGKADCPLKKLADIHIGTVAGKYADRVQELHIKIIHTLVELVERELYPENYHHE